MSDERARPQLRIRVAGDPDLTWDLGPAEVADVDEIDRRPPRAVVEELAPTALDRAAGVRQLDVTVQGWTFRVTVEAEARARLRERASQDEAGHHQHGPIAVRSPMSGRVVRLWVAEGATVEAGQRLLAVEAMKMENEVRAPRAGVVTSIGVAVGDIVELGDELATVR
jgi:biotin carboxyl carrier protein